MPKKRSGSWKTRYTVPYRPVVVVKGGREAREEGRKEEAPRVRGPKRPQLWMPVKDGGRNWLPMIR